MDDNFVKTVKAIFGDDVKYFTNFENHFSSVPQMYTNKFYEMCRKIIDYAMHNGNMKVIASSNYIKKKDPHSRWMMRHLLGIKRLPNLLKIRHQTIEFSLDDFDIVIEVDPGKNMQIILFKKWNGQRRIFNCLHCTARVYYKIFLRSVLHETADITKHITDIQLTYLLLNGFCDKGEI